MRNIGCHVIFFRGGIYSREEAVSKPWPIVPPFHLLRLSIPLFPSEPSRKRDPKAKVPKVAGKSAGKGSKPTPIWSKHVCPRSGAYYYNHYTGLTQWDEPKDFNKVEDPKPRFGERLLVTNLPCEYRFI